MTISKHIPGSFRDPSGFVFYEDGTLYRQINVRYKEHYDALIDSGLCEALVNDALLVSHEEAGIGHSKSDNAYKMVRPEVIRFISYPYEWCFSQLRDAALTTLKIQKKALEFGMTLKDASAYNIQFRKGKPILIDTLSFEKYREGEPWIAYRQFCQHFLAPLALISYTDVRLGRLFRLFIDGIPLDLASRLLPFRTRFVPSLFLHVHLHAGSQRYFAGRRVNVRKAKRKVGRLGVLGLIDSLESGVRGLKWKLPHTEWADYYHDTNYSKEALEHKRNLVAEFLDQIDPGVVWDLGANLGLFSRIASDKGMETISFDVDVAAVEKNYLESVRRNEQDILPLLLDLTNPSPNIGWQNEERESLIARGPARTAMALALVHHLAISNNLPLDRIADFLSDICSFLVIEFVPKSDSQVQRLLSTREDIFTDYTQEAFEGAFSQCFTIRNSMKIRDSERVLYLMKKK
ncbi:MAG: SAM-dependent methyltransferase [Candidatus Eisenbacteria bacterium]